MFSFSRKLIILLLVFVLVMITSCINDNETSEKAIAIVNKEKIMITELEDEILALEFVDRVKNKVSKQIKYDGSISADVLVELLRRDKEKLTEDEIQYVKRYSRELLTENEVFNKIIRDVVLFQEARKYVPVVSIEEAREITEQAKQASIKMVENGSEEDKLTWKTWIKCENEVARQYGFKSSDELREAFRVYAARTLTINRMKNKFYKKIITPELNLEGIDLTIYEQNAWEDYTEFLLKRSNIKIIKDNLQIVFYGKEWDKGYLKFKDNEQ